MASVNETAEAVCSALYRVEFAHLGDTENGRNTWFQRGTRPKVLRVQVERADRLGMVFIHLTWPNISLPQRIIRGRTQLQVNVKGTDSEVAMATETAVVRCLEIFRDILQGTGVASREAAVTALRN